MTLARSTRSTACMAATALLVAGVDLATKSVAAGGGLPAPWFAPDVNPDLALGIAGAGPWPDALLGVAALLAVAVVLGRVVARDDRARTSVAVGLVVGGSVGNLADRLLGGAVRDFIAGPGILFNLADLALLAGVVLLVSGRLPSGDRPPVASVPVRGS